MITQILDSTRVGLPDRLDPAQEERAAAFAKMERQHKEKLDGKIPTPSIQVKGAGMTTTNYSINMSADGSGLAQLDFSATTSEGRDALGDYDWVGIFQSTDEAVQRSAGYGYLAGLISWRWAAGSPSFVSDVALQPGMVAAYVIKKGDDDYLTVAFTTPWPQKV